MAVLSPVKADHEIQGGTPCFAGTRVPVKSLFDTIERGKSVEAFLQQFPSVSRELASRVLQHAELLIELHTPFEAETAADSTALAEALDKAQSLLNLTDEDGKFIVIPSALVRAADFLRRSEVRCRLSCRSGLPIPRIQPGPDGSVDLHWLNDNSETLVNVPAEAKSPITFYGDDRLGNSIKGNLVSDDNGGLVLWLTKQ